MSAALRPTLGFAGSYPPKDVTFLLKDLSGLVEETPLLERERRLQQGGHYSETLPVEYRPSPEYTALFHKTLAAGAEQIARLVAVTAQRILHVRGPRFVLVSLARAGTPIGVLLRRYLTDLCALDVPHYSVSIIRGRGIDRNAIDHITTAHPGIALQFVDGWTGKGIIQQELNAAVTPLGLDDKMAVLADPASSAHIYGTREDVLIPSACLNATVSGLVSRTVLNELVRSDDFHGAKVYSDLASEDLSRVFVDAVAEYFGAVGNTLGEWELQCAPPSWKGMEAVGRIAADFGITDVNLVKPGIGEATRVLLRRRPWKMLVHPTKTAALEHLLLLAQDRQIPVEDHGLMPYACCGLISSVSIPSW